ncbi:MAG: C39 family peptidase [Chloroflexi bacterium]|nr:C39 family peptidase [Chloroflexota bacterium]
MSESTGLMRAADTIQLARQSDGAYVTNGALISEQHLTEFPFNNAVISWNAETPAGTSLELQLRVRVGDSVSPWFTMETWSATGGASVGGQSNEWGRVNIDTLELGSYANSLQYRIAFATSNPATSPRLRSAAIVYSDSSTQLVGPRVDVAKGWIRDLDVPQYSQLEQSADVAREICSPTSLAMVLNFWGKGKAVKDVYEGVRDARTGIFGNWPLNTAYAGALGLDAYVDRFYSLEQLQNEIAQGRPIIISIRFQPGQLDNSPINSTTGHLIVVRGFTPQGDVIVNDPIAPNSATVRRVYKRDQLAQIWRDSGGIAYVIRPKQ